MFSVYIIYSKKIDQYYIGQTENIENRLYRHNNNGSKSTKKANDWVLKYTQEFHNNLDIIDKPKITKYFFWVNPKRSDKIPKIGSIIASNIRKKNKNVTDETIDMMVDDYMEEAHNIQEIDDEVYDMEYMDEDFFNGNTDGTDAPETDYNDYYDDA
jgi:putative endonuclease